MTGSWDHLHAAIALRAPELHVQLEVTPRNSERVRARLIEWQDWKEDVSRELASIEGPTLWVANALNDLIEDYRPIMREEG